MRSKSASEVWMSMPDREQLADREEQARLQGGERDQRADRDRVAAVGEALSPRTSRRARA